MLCFLSKYFCQYSDHSIAVRCHYLLYKNSELVIMRKLLWLSLFSVIAISSACRKKPKKSNNVSTVTKSTRPSYHEPLNTTERPILPMKNSTNSNTSIITKTQLQLAIGKEPGHFIIFTITPAEHMAKIEWTPSEGAKSYTISRGISPGDYSTIVSTDAKSPYSDEGLDNATTYYYMISAVNDSGKTNSDVSVPVTTPGCFGKMGAGAWHLYPSTDSSFALKVTKLQCEAFNMACDQNSTQALCTHWY